MFVQEGSGMSSDNQSITLHGAGGATLLFADRPDRVVGHVSTEEFVDEGGNREKSFAAEPPNAVNPFQDGADATPEDRTLGPRDPQLAGDALSYNVEVLGGT